VLYCVRTNLCKEGEQLGSVLGIVQLILAVGSLRLSHWTVDNIIRALSKRYPIGSLRIPRCTKPKTEPSCTVSLLCGVVVGSQSGLVRRSGTS
jgi:hypothetical protein